MRSDRGFTFIEALFVTGLVAVLTAAAVPQTLAGIDEWQTAGAARYIAARLYRARMDAAVRNADTALRFVQIGAAYEYSTVADGNRNGVRAGDVATGVDRTIHPAERLADRFPGVVFGALPGLPPVDPSGTPPGSDPIRLGTGDMAIFTAFGSSSPGSIYLRGRGPVQYVVRVFGETGRIRVLKFHGGTREWKQL
jgi:type II secretory pathway pseudopilin PulG